MLRHTAPHSWRVVKELRMRGDDLDSQAFSSSAADVDGFELAALYTLRETPSRSLASSIGK
jgi:hypothetical protein